MRVLLALPLLSACTVAAPGLAPLDDVAVDWTGCLVDEETGMPEPDCDVPGPRVLALAAVVERDGVPLEGRPVVFASTCEDVHLLPPSVVEAGDADLMASLGSSPVAYDGSWGPMYEPKLAEVDTDADGIARVIVWVDRLPQASDGRTLDCPISVSGGATYQQLRLTP